MGQIETVQWLGEQVRDLLRRDASAGVAHHQLGMVAGLAQLEAAYQPVAAAVAALLERQEK